MIPKNRYNNDELPTNLHGQKYEPIEPLVQPTTKEVLKIQLVQMQPTTLRQTYTLFSGDIETQATAFDRITLANEPENEPTPTE